MHDHIDYRKITNDQSYEYPEQMAQNEIVMMSHTRSENLSVSDEIEVCKVLALVGIAKALRELNS